MEPAARGATVLLGDRPEAPTLAELAAGTRYKRKENQDISWMLDVDRHMSYVQPDCWARPYKIIGTTSVSRYNINIQNTFEG